MRPEEIPKKHTWHLEWAEKVLTSSQPHYIAIFKARRGGACL